eukprot:GAHX01001233.1.p1 GENE.GAHX01001233.1~~GAHX01001233.1.p1  ORF type:complete len:262 (-),score=32.07 GAHX01001233.1:461-1246(-)
MMVSKKSKPSKSKTPKVNRNKGNIAIYMSSLNYLDTHAPSYEPFESDPPVPFDYVADRQHNFLYSTIPTLLNRACDILERLTRREEKCASENKDLKTVQSSLISRDACAHETEHFIIQAQAAPITAGQLTSSPSLVTPKKHDTACGNLQKMYTNDKKEHPKLYKRKETTEELRIVPRIGRECATEERNDEREQEAVYASEQTCPASEVKLLLFDENKINTSVVPMDQRAAIHEGISNPTCVLPAKPIAETILARLKPPTKI